MGAKALDRKFTSLIGICIKGLCIQFVMRADKKLNGTALIVKKRQQDIVDFVQRSQEVSPLKPSGLICESWILRAKLSGPMAVRGQWMGKLI
jgi:hypothetical protein